jgi:RNA polymerase sigma-70 factor, ECF subfamily
MRNMVCALWWGETRVENVCMSTPFARPASRTLLRTAQTADSNGRDPVEADVVALFEELRHPLLRYLWSFGVPLPDGEEVIQETFLALYRHLREGKPRDNLRGWLFRVAHNLAAKRRYRSRRDLETMAGTNSDWAIDPGPNPEDQAVNSQTQKRLRAVLQALPEQDRRCLFLRAEGLRYREIAEALNMSLGAVSISLSRSLARIARSAER